MKKTNYLVHISLLTAFFILFGSVAGIDTIQAQKGKSKKKAETAPVKGKLAVLLKFGDFIF